MSDFVVLQFIVKVKARKGSSIIFAIYQDGKKIYTSQAVEKTKEFIKFRKLRQLHGETPGAKKWVIRFFNLDVNNHRLVFLGELQTIFEYLFQDPGRTSITTPKHKNDECF